MEGKDLNVSTHFGSNCEQVENRIGEDNEMASSREIVSHDLNSSTPEPPNPFNDASNISLPTNNNVPSVSLSRSIQTRIASDSPNTSTTKTRINQPQSLFIQALTKLNEDSVKFTVINIIKTQQEMAKMALNDDQHTLSAPDSLMSAPPSYSFVLRQIAARPRTRFMGTFIPSPSFIQHTPPPNYASAFDVYVDNPMPRPSRIYNFGFSPMFVSCPECGYTGMSIAISQITMSTHMCAFILCLFCCWICVPLPYVMRSCKHVNHFCANCRHHLGRYCPTNPESCTHS